MLVCSSKATSELLDQTVHANLSIITVQQQLEADVCLKTKDTPMFL